MTPFDDPTEHSKSVDMAPVTISIVGTGTGDGGGAAPTPSGTVAVTPGQQPNLIVNVVSPLMAIAVRFVNTYLTTFVGLLTAAGFGNEVFKATDFHSVLVASALGSLSVSGIGLLKNIVTIFGRLEGKYPLTTGSI